MLELLAHLRANNFKTFIVHHTDADRASRVGKLDKGLDAAAAKGWAVGDMKTDWKTVFKP